MPVKSKQQFKKFQVMCSHGDLPKEKCDEFLKGVSYKNLPDRYQSVHYKRKSK